MVKYHKYIVSTGRTIHNLHIGNLLLRWGTRNGRFEAGPWWDWKFRGHHYNGGRYDD